MECLASGAAVHHLERLLNCLQAQSIGWVFSSGVGGSGERFAPLLEQVFVEVPREKKKPVPLIRHWLFLNILGGDVVLSSKPSTTTGLRCLVETS